MRAWTWLAFLALCAGASSAQAQEVAAPDEGELPDVRAPGEEPEGDAPPPALGSALDPESYVALSADDQAQLGLGGFRRYLERIRPTDAGLYVELDPGLDALEESDTAADVIFGIATGLAVAALVAAIPVYTELGDREDGSAAAIGLAASGAGIFVLGLIVQAIVRPGHSDLLRLIDRHDELLGRR